MSAGNSITLHKAPDIQQVVVKRRIPVVTFSGSKSGPVYQHGPISQEEQYMAAMMQQAGASPLEQVLGSRIGI